MLAASVCMCRCWCRKNVQHADIIYSWMRQIYFCLWIHKKVITKNWPHFFLSRWFYNVIFGCQAIQLNSLCLANTTNRTNPFCISKILLNYSKTNYVIIVSCFSCNVLIESISSIRCDIRYLHTHTHIER